jgi:hypothetical protein
MVIEAKYQLPKAGSLCRVKGWKIEKYVNRLIDKGEIENQNEIADRLGIKPARLSKIIDRNRQLYDERIKFELVQKIARMMGRKPWELIYDPRTPEFDKQHLWKILEQRAGHERVVLQQTARDEPVVKRAERADIMAGLLEDARLKCDELGGCLEIFLRGETEAPKWQDVHKLFTAIYVADDECHEALLTYDEEREVLRQHLKAGDACLRSCYQTLREQFPTHRLTKEGADLLNKKLTNFVIPTLTYHDLVADELRKEKMDLEKLWKALKEHVVLLAKLVFPDTTTGQIFRRDSA